MRLLFVACFVLAAFDPHSPAQSDPRQDELALKSRVAKQALLDGRYTEAAALYRELLKALPDNVGLRLNLAIALDKAGQPSAAVPKLARVTRADPTSAPAWLLLGLAYQQLNQPRNAIAPLREAVRLAARNPSALLELADAELTAGDAQGALKDFGALAAAEPGSPKAWEGLGRAYLSLSETSFRQLEKQAPDSPYFLALLARSRASGERYSDALSLYANALEHDRDLPGIHAARAEIYRQTKHDDSAAIETDRESRTLKPDYSRRPAACAYLAGGDLLLLPKRDDEALAHLVAATGRLPDLLPAPEALGRVYLALGRPAEAVAHLERARALDDGSISFALNSAYRQLGRQEEARAALARYRAITKQRSADNSLNEAPISLP